MSDRRGLYKYADRDAESSRRNRQDHSVEIRKVKKLDNLEKRRNIVLEDLSDVSPVKDCGKKNPSLSVKAICKQMRSKDAVQRLEAVRMCRSALSKQKSPPIEQYYKEGAVKTLVKVMKISGQSESELIFEAAWALTNIASGESRHTSAVVEQGGVDVFINLLDHADDNIAEQSVWALANIAGDSADHRDKIVAKGIVPVVVKAVTRFWSNASILRQLSWFISNIFRHKSDCYPYKAVTELLPLIYHIISNQSDSQIIADITWGLAYATDSNDDIVDAVIANNLLLLVNNNLASSNEVVIPSIRLMGNVIAGTDAQASSAIDVGVINAMKHVLSNDSSRIVKEACWLLSNISAGTEEQVMTLVNSGVVLSVLEVLQNGDYKAKKEAVWVISNMITCKKDEPKLYLLNNNVFKFLVPLLSCDDTKAVVLILDSIKMLLKVSENYNELQQCINVFEEAGGMDVLEDLQNHSSEEVYELCYELLKDYLGAEDDEEENEETLQQFAF